MAMIAPSMDEGKRRLRHEALRPPRTIPDSRRVSVSGPRAVLRRASFFFLNGKIGEAESRLRMIVQEMPKLKLPRRMLAEIYCREGETRKAQFLFGRLCNCGIFDKDIGLMLIKAAYREGNLRLADSVFQKLCDEKETDIFWRPHPTDILTGKEYPALIAMSSESGDLGKARRYFEHAACNCLLSARTFASIISACGRAGDVISAEKLHQLSVDSRMDSRGVHKAMLEVYREAGDIGNALAVLDIMFSRRVLDVSSIVEMAVYCISRKEFGNALVALELGHYAKMIQDPDLALDLLRFPVTLWPTPPRSGRFASTG
ncbi:MAG: hypothetical protein ABII71_02235 [Candidatus Micrarchaeota archaeon]